MNTGKLLVPFIFIILSTYTNYSMACSCAEIGAGNIDKPKYIFIGYPENIKFSFKFWEKKKSNQFKVTKNYKGSLGDYVTVKSRTDSAACGMGYVADVKYLIFGGGKNGIVSSGACGSFKVESQEGQRLIELLNKIQNE